MAMLTSPQWEFPRVEALLHPVAEAIGLPALARVFPIVVLACASSFALQRVSSVLSPRLFPKYYPTLPAKRDDWDLHVVGWAYSLIATPLAFNLIRNKSIEIALDPLYGYGVPEGRLSAIATGYFLWDAWVSARHIHTQGLGFFLHGAGCCLAFLFTLKPFLLFCGPNFLMWELSTIFLNVHWYLDKFHMTGSTLQLVNGAFLLAAYIGARLIWGTYQSYVVISLLFGPKRNPAVGHIRYLYGGVNLMLNALNFFWFRSMIFALRKRFVKADPNAKKEAIEVDGKLSWKRNGDNKKVQ